MHTRETWEAFLKERDTGGIVEMDEDIFDYFLDVLPPAWMNREITMPDGRQQRIAFGFAEGWENVTAFWRKREADGALHFYCQLTNILNPNR